jgi:hypothetical protein
VLASVVVALVPIVVATIRAIDHGWVPAGDNGLIAVRVRDVFSHHPPLLYTWSTASLWAGFGFNHPGPLLFDVLAVPTAIFKGSDGLAIGAALLNGLSLIGIAVFAFRRGGALLASVGVAMTTLLCWVMGSELLFDPWSPNSLMLPLLLFLVLAWSLGCGDLAALPWAVVVGSLLVQTNLGFGLLVPALAGWGVLGLVAALRRQRRAAPDSWPARRRRALRIGIVAGLVLVACWVQPVIEQLTSRGEGNLTLIARGLGRVPTVDRGRGFWLFADVNAMWWRRGSLRRVYSSPPSHAFAMASLLFSGGMLAGAAWIARRRRDPVATAAVAAAAVAAAAGLFSAIRSTTDSLGAIVPYQSRWLWPLSAFLAVAVVASLVRWAASNPPRSRSLVHAFSIATVVFAGLNLQTGEQGSDAPAWTLPVVRDLNRQLGGLEEEGTLYVDWSAARPFAQHYGSAVLAELDRRGIPFVVAKQVLVRTLGPTRRFTGANAAAELRVGTGNDADELAPGTRRVAAHEGLSPTELRELSTLKGQITQYIRDGRLRLTPEAMSALGRLAGIDRGSSNGTGSDPDELFASGGLVGLVRRGFLVLEERWAPRFERFADLQGRRDTTTVALFLRPLDAAPAGAR